jgi:hypothetical protein
MIFLKIKRVGQIWDKTVKRILNWNGGSMPQATQLLCKSCLRKMAHHAFAHSISSALVLSFSIVIYASLQSSVVSSTSNGDK